MAEVDRPRELDILSGPQLGFLSLVRIIAVLIARTGETTVEIGAAELDALPEVPALATWRNINSFTDSIHVELPDEVVEQIRTFGRGLADERAGIVDAEIVEDESSEQEAHRVAAEIIKSAVPIDEYFAQLGLEQPREEHNG